MCKICKKFDPKLFLTGSVKNVGKIRLCPTKQPRVRKTLAILSDAGILSGETPDTPMKK
jgi:hypothetical protein